MGRLLPGLREKGHECSEMFAVFDPHGPGDLSSILWRQNLFY